MKPCPTALSLQGIGPACKHLRAREVPHEDIKLILRVHNYLRVKVANGWEHRGEGNQAQPNAANMLQLVSGIFLVAAQGGDFRNPLYITQYIF